MPSSLMLRSSFRSSSCAALGALALAGCPSPSPTCGTGGLTASTLAASGGGTDVQYGAFTANANNDCPADGAPAGVISVTITAAQTTPAGTSSLTFCLPRPDLVAETGDATLALGGDLDVLAVGGAFDGCVLHDLSDITGSAQITGYCGADDTSGFALALIGEVSVRETKTCTGMPDESITVTLSGSAPGQSGN